MNCLWIILLLSCFGGNTFGRSGGNDDDCNQSRRSRCRNAVENAVNECGSERAVERALNERDNDGCGRDFPGPNPSHWQDFPSVASANSGEDCGCE